MLVGRRRQLYREQRQINKAAFTFTDVLRLVGEEASRTSAASGGIPGPEQLVWRNLALILCTDKATMVAKVRFAKSVPERGRRGKQVAGLSVYSLRPTNVYSEASIPGASGVIGFVSARDTGTFLTLIETVLFHPHLLRALYLNRVGVNMRCGFRTGSRHFLSRSKFSPVELGGEAAPS